MNACQVQIMLIETITPLEAKIVSEYDKEIPQSQTVDKPVVSRGRATQQS